MLNQAIISRFSEVVMPQTSVIKSPKWYHTSVAVASMLLMFASLGYSYYTHNAGWFALGITIMFFATLWAVVDPFLHGYWHVAARGIFNWLKSPRALKRCAATVAFYIIPWMVRSMLSMPMLFFPEKYLDSHMDRFWQREMEVYLPAHKRRLARWKL